MRKQVVTLNISGNYEPEITKLTMPYIYGWSKKIGAEFHTITERVFNQKSVTYEKFQLYELSKGYDWTLFIDADTLIHPDCPDWSEFLSKDTVCFNGVDLNLIRFRANNYTRRSNLLYGACTWNVIFSDWCRDLWHPMQETTFDECMENIQPIQHEKLSETCSKEHLIDDYLVTQNIARYGLKVTTIGEIIKNRVHQDLQYYHHLYACSVEEKIKTIIEAKERWKIT